MTLAEKLTAAGLPFVTASENGTVDSSGYTLTPEQEQAIANITLEHTNPAAYADAQAFHAEGDNIKNNYTTFDQWLEDCIARGNPNSTDIHHIAQILQSLMSLKVSEMPEHPSHPPHPPHGSSVVKI